MTNYESRKFRNLVLGSFFFLIKKNSQEKEGIYLLIDSYIRTLYSVSKFKN